MAQISTSKALVNFKWSLKFTYHFFFREHEVSFNQHLINHNQEDPKEIDENHEMHTKRQMDLNIQLTEIQKNIVIKEGLAKQLNNQYIVDYEVSHFNTFEVLYVTFISDL